MVQIFNSKFNEPIPGVPNPPEYRDENLRYMDSLNYLAEQHGLVAYSFPQTSDQRYYVQYLDLHLWDARDRNLSVEEALHQCTISSKPYPKFDDMVMEEIKRLREQL